MIGAAELPRLRACEGVEVEAANAVLAELYGTIRRLEEELASVAAAAAAAAVAETEPPARFDEFWRDQDEAEEVRRQALDNVLGPLAAVVPMAFMLVALTVVLHFV